MGDETTARAAARPMRKVRTGVVTSAKMTKTVTVELARTFAHPQYGKRVTRRSRLKARNDLGAREGDVVRVMETRPLARTVRWRVAEIVERAK
jgi:small subunit ribosomal protein S17